MQMTSDVSFLSRSEVNPLRSPDSTDMIITDTNAGKSDVRPFAIDFAVSEKKLRKVFALKPFFET